MENINCCVCGVRIYFDEHFFKILQKTHNIFYCLNGHAQSFKGKNEAEKQKEICDMIKQQSNKRIDELKQEIISLKNKPKKNKHKKK